LVKLRRNRGVEDSTEVLVPCILGLFGQVHILLGVGQGGFKCALINQRRKKTHVQASSQSLLTFISGSRFVVGATTGSTLSLTQRLDTSKVTALDLTGGTVAGSTINNHGTTRGNRQLNSAGFVNDGSLVASGGGQLTLNTAVSPDLDGNSDAGTMHALSADIVIVDALVDAFDGDITVENGFAIEFQQGWTQGPTGRLFTRTIRLSI
jgi:hypothetical protein